MFVREPYLVKSVCLDEHSTTKIDTYLALDMLDAHLPILNKFAGLEKFLSVFGKYCKCFRNIFVSINTIFKSATKMQSSERQLDDW